MIKEEVLLLMLFDLLKPRFENVNGIDIVWFTCDKNEFGYALVKDESNRYQKELIQEWINKKGELKSEQA